MSARGDDGDKDEDGDDERYLSLGRIGSRRRVRRRRKAGRDKEGDRSQAKDEGGGLDERRMCDCAGLYRENERISHGSSEGRRGNQLTVRAMVADGRRERVQGKGVGFGEGKAAVPEVAYFCLNILSRLGIVLIFLLARES
jgi:hypothetical protein